MGWVTLHAVAIFAGLASAFWAAVGIVVRQRVTQTFPDEQAISRGVVASVIKEPMWWAGTLAAVGGYGFQALALAHGSLLLVQPLLVSSLLFALPLSAWLCRQRLTWAELGWALLLTAALAVFLLVGQPREGHNRPPVPAWTLALLFAVPLGIGCVIAANRSTGRIRAMLLGVTVAVLLGMIAVLTKICTHRYSVGGWHHLLDVPAPYVLVALAVTVTVVQNAAFHAGALQASVPIMLVGEPMIAVALGIVVLGEHVAVKGSAALILVAAVVAMVAATVALGRGQARDAESASTASSSDAEVPELVAASPGSDRPKR